MEQTYLCFGCGRKINGIMEAEEREEMRGWKGEKRKRGRVRKLLKVENKIQEGTRRKGKQHRRETHRKSGEKIGRDGEAKEKELVNGKRERKKK